VEELQVLLLKVELLFAGGSFWPPAFLICKRFVDCPQATPALRRRRAARHRNSGSNEGGWEYNEC
jgi:hypothetical protein